MLKMYYDQLLIHEVLLLGHFLLNNNLSSQCKRHMLPNVNFAKGYSYS